MATFATPAYFPVANQVDGHFAARIVVGVIGQSFIHPRDFTAYERPRPRPIAEIPSYGIRR